jgi:hypothetical protein
MSKKTSGAKIAAASTTIDIGIATKDRAAIAEGLSRLLADTYTLYLTTHNFHWNVTGPMFNTLHVMFMGQYTELWNAVDPIAERIRSLGHRCPMRLRRRPRRSTWCACWWPATRPWRAPRASCSRSPTRPATSPPPTC